MRLRFNCILGTALTSIGTIVAPQALAQSVGSGPLIVSSLPASGTITLIVMLLGIAAIAYATLSKKKRYIAAIAGPSLVLASTAALVISPELRAQVDFVQFTNPKGELIDLSGQFRTGTFYFQVNNQSGSTLKVVEVNDPEPSDCFLGIGKPDALAKPDRGTNRFEEPGYPACTVGHVLAAGETCTLDFFSFCGDT